MAGLPPSNLILPPPGNQGPQQPRVQYLLLWRIAMCDQDRGWRLGIATASRSKDGTHTNRDLGGCDRNGAQNKKGIFVTGVPGEDMRGYWYVLDKGPGGPADRQVDHTWRQPDNYHVEYAHRELQRKGLLGCWRGPPGGPYDPSIGPQGRIYVGDNPRPNAAGQVVPAPLAAGPPVPGPLPPPVVDIDFLRRLPDDADMYGIDGPAPYDAVIPYADNPAIETHFHDAFAHHHMDPDQAILPQFQHPLPDDDIGPVDPEYQDPVAPAPVDHELVQNFLPQLLQGAEPELPIDPQLLLSPPNPQHLIPAARFDEVAARRGQDYPPSDPSSSSDILGADPLDHPGPGIYLGPGELPPQFADPYPIAPLEHNAPVAPTPPHLGPETPPALLDAPAGQAVHFSREQYHLLFPHLSMSRLNSLWGYEPFLQSNDPEELAIEAPEIMDFLQRLNPRMTAMYVTPRPVARPGSPGPVFELWSDQAGMVPLDHPAMQNNRMPVLATERLPALATIPLNTRLWPDVGLGIGRQHHCDECGAVTEGICESIEHHPRGHIHICGNCDADSRRELLRILEEIDFVQQTRYWLCYPCTAKVNDSPQDHHTHSGTRVFDPVVVTMPGEAAASTITRGGLFPHLPLTGCSCGTKLLQRRLCTPHRTAAFLDCALRIHRWMKYMAAAGGKPCPMCLSNPSPDGPQGPASAYYCLCCSGLVIKWTGEADEEVGPEIYINAYPDFRNGSP
ncbi:hypothetical protein JX265_003723 [Neoarthrinium moseri]|uniref:Uncharacterized protein n=1 Tax=Neoarthrinium moseri TaxID=1658444 RepID=A0A9Q0ASH5_9PEZI|nr:hypothetical protein JX266_001095 [Neoarthrinium moseri]KAI1877715.1 hypothetical protein JX265_003723 [Neoarthrinium moseri]